MPTNDDDPAAMVLSVPLLQEALDIRVTSHVSDTVRVRTVTDAAEEIVRRELNGVDVSVERVPLDLMLERDAPPPQIRTEGDVTVIPIFREVLVVETRFKIVEELRIIRRPTSEITEFAVTLRSERAVIERLTSDGAIVTEPEENPR